jgi:hypothetical protein
MYAVYADFTYGETDSFTSFSAKYLVFTSVSPTTLHLKSYYLRKLSKTIFCIPYFVSTIKRHSTRYCESKYKNVTCS